MRAGAEFFAMYIKETRAGGCKVQYMLERDDRATICHHHNNVKTAAARCAIGMMLCVGAPVYIWMPMVKEGERRSIVYLK